MPDSPHQRPRLSARNRRSPPPGSTRRALPCQRAPRKEPRVRPATRTRRNHGPHRCANRRRRPQGYRYSAPTCTKANPNVGPLTTNPIEGNKNGRRPTLPRSLPRSTIGAGGLNFSVRNGKRCIPAAIVTLSKKRQVFSCKGRLPFENRTARTVKHQALDLLVPLGYIHRCTYTCGLSTWWSTRSLTPSKGMGDLISRRASRLDAFSGYPFRT